jgi:hypothetical protein
MPLLLDEQMQPPVALLLYQADAPHNAAFYPFAQFSPEWQALQFGCKHKLATRFMDLPQTHQMALGHAVFRMPFSPIQADPIGALAAADGFSDGERWWERMVEHRRDGADVFAAIGEAMTALRAEAQVEAAQIQNAASLEEEEDNQEDAEMLAVAREMCAKREAMREAWMRHTIRQAEKEGFKNIAVVCGAWHVPALSDALLKSEKAADDSLLSGLAKVKVEATWTPWTYSRLSSSSGYGAGITSPGWYHHLWTTEEQIVTRWLTTVARLLREEDVDVSSAHVIEAVRLAESLAALRACPLPGLAEMNEAVRAIFCFGDDVSLQLIHDKLIVSERLGSVPDAVPCAPLAEDLQREQKRLRLKPEAASKPLDLDLRKPNDLDRSRLLHRLNLLEVAWGKLNRQGGGKGTFHETWQLEWQPEFAIALIEAGVWGNTIAAAASGKARKQIDESDLAALTEMLGRVLLSDLPDAVSHLLTRLQNEAALASDVTLLMDALPPLIEVERYSDVRKTDAALLATVTRGLVARACIGLPGACSSLDDEAASALFARLNRVHQALSLLSDEALMKDWRKTLKRLADLPNLHGLMAGRATRLLYEAREFAAEETARRLSLALSRASEPAAAGAWVAGFLHGSGLLLLHDETLWQVIDAWITQLHGDNFTAVLPLLRRTFAEFPVPERRQMAERVQRGGARVTAAAASNEAFDQERAALVLPLVRQLLGLEMRQV